MSNITTTRAKLRQWLESFIRIDQWDADPPDKLYSSTSTDAALYPANTAIEYPVKNLIYRRTDVSGVTGAGEFSISIVYRYPGELTLHELPVEKMEAVSQYIQAMSLLSLSGCEGIRHAEPADNNEFPVQVQRMENDQSDWLIFCNVTLLIEFALTDFGIDPEFGTPPEAPTPLDNLDVRIYRSVAGFDTTDPADSTLDAELSLDYL